MFEGALHEEVFDLDTGRQLAVQPIDYVALEQLGYDVNTAEQTAKAQRNLSIATAANQSAPTPKTAMDLARSIAYAGGSTADAATVVRAGIQLASMATRIKRTAVAPKAAGSVAVTP